MTWREGKVEGAGLKLVEDYRNNKVSLKIERKEYIYEERNKEIPL